MVLKRNGFFALVESHNVDDIASNRLDIANLQDIGLFTEVAADSHQRSKKFSGEPDSVSLLPCTNILYLCKISFEGA